MGVADQKHVSEDIRSCYAMKSEPVTIIYSNTRSTERQKIQCENRVRGKVAELKHVWCS